MNKVQILREVIVKIIPMITSRGLRVTQIGAQAFVQTDLKTLKPVRVNIPHLPDDASDDLCLAVQGFIDHEVGHVLDTDWTSVKKALELGASIAASRKMKPAIAAEKMKHYHNIVEDTFVERCMVKRFKGSAYNIDRLYDVFINKITKPALDAAKSDAEQFSILMVPLIRAWSGQQKFIDFIQSNGYDKNPLVVEFTKRVPKEARELIETAKDSWGTLKAAEAIFDVLHPEPPPPPPPPPPAPPQPQPPEPDEDQDQDDQEDSDSEKSDDPDGEGSNQDKPEDEDDKGSEGEPQPADADEEKDEDEDDQGETEADDESGDQPADAQDDGTDADGESEPSEQDGSDEDGDDAAAGAGEDDDDDEPEGEKPDAPDTGGDDAEDETDEEDGDDEAEGSDGGDDEAEGSDGGADEPAEDEPDQGEDSDTGGEDDAGDEPENEGGEDAGNDEPGDDEADQEGADGKDEVEGDGKGDLEDSDADDGESAGTSEEEDADGEEADSEEEGEQSQIETDVESTPNPFETTPIEDGDDMAKAIAVMITDEATRDVRDADYRIWTTEYDKIEKFPVPDDLPAGWVTALDDRTRHMVAPMQKDIERMMAARSQVVKVPGYRSGRLHSGSLHRLQVNDDRVFRRITENKSKETAVSLLIDNSGSMYGEKLVTAMAAGYALSQTLERVGIKHEVLGFTTGGYPDHKVWQELQAEEARIGKGFSRLCTTYMPIYKNFSERLTPDVKRRFAAAPKYAPAAANVDGEAVRTASNRLDMRSEPRKVLIVMSDGQPSGYSHYPEEIHADLHRAVKQAEARKIETIGIGIMDAAVKTYYPKYTVLKKLDDLPKAVMGELKRILTQ